MFDSIFRELFPSIWDCDSLPIWLTVDDEPNKEPQSYSYERHITFEDGELKRNTKKVTLNGDVVVDEDYLKPKKVEDSNKCKCKGPEPGQKGCDSEQKGKEIPVGNEPKLDWKCLYEEQVKKSNKIERENAELKAQVEKIKKMLNI